MTTSQNSSEFDKSENVNEFDIRGFQTIQRKTFCLIGGKLQSPSENHQ